MGDRVRRLGTVRVRTTVVATLVVGIALAIGGLLLVRLLHSSLVDNVQTAAELRARDVTASIEGGAAPSTLTVAGEEKSLIQVLDRTGAVVASSENVAGEPAIARVAVGEERTVDRLPISDHDPYSVVARKTRNGQFTVLVAQSLGPADQSTALVGRVLFAGIPVLLLLVAGTTWVVAGRALRPVERIRAQVAAISADQLGRRVPEPAGEDEIARLARTMNAMLDRLERSQDRQRRFVSDASHELRSPIATIQHQLEVALAHPDGVTVDGLANELLSEDRRMAHVVEDLLLLARADEDILRVGRRPVDVDDLLLAEAGRLRQRGKVTVDTTAISAGRVLGDRAQLARLVRNLVDNAERHAVSRVNLGLEASSNAVRLSVADDGAGVPAAERQRIFERFTRLDDERARDSGGAGLGLAIVAEVARAHGGSVRVEGDSGARFVVTLPAADTDGRGG
ncbi:MAG TPA: ATP-binding protein [Acidimicrobiia bacterium]